MARAFGWFYLFAFVVSVGIHVSTFMPGMSLTAAMGSVAFILVFFGLHLTSILAVPIAGVFYAMLRMRMKKENQSVQLWPQLLRWIPRPVVVLCGALACYSFINGMLFVGRMEGGGPAERDGQYYLQNHGKVIRQLDREEFDRFRAYEIRAFSGGWMLFTVIPATFLLYVYPAAVAEYTEEPVIDPRDDW